MNTYKVTNITDNLGKRNPNFNSTLKITYVDKMEKRVIYLKPKNIIYFTTESLPLSLHKFRMNGLVNVEEIDDKQLSKIKNEQGNNTITKEKDNKINKPTKKQDTSKNKSTKKYSSSKSKSTKKYSSSKSKSTTSNYTKKDDVEIKNDENEE